MRVRVDTDRCASSGMCALTAPDVFAQGADDGVVVLRDAAPPPDRFVVVRLAAARCASQAIEVTEEDHRLV